MRPLACRAAALIICIELFAAATGARAAWAQAASTPEELARRHHERGTTYYNLGQFDEAIAEYRRGYEQKGDPVFLFNIGQSYRQLGDVEKALFFYRRYLSIAVGGSNRKLAEQRVTELEALVDARREGAPAPPEAAAPGALAAGGPAVDDVARPDLVAPAPTPAGPSGPPLWQRWWIWAGVAGLLVGGVAVALVASTSGKSPQATNELGTMRFF